MHIKIILETEEMCTKIYGKKMEFTNRVIQEKYELILLFNNERSIHEI